jgi:hypothetical protein
MVSQNAFMGMFDEVKCEAPFPDPRMDPERLLQSKSLACCMDRYTITREGRLIYHRHHYEEGPSREVRQELILPTRKLTHVENIDTEYHGDIRLYGNGKEGAWLDYVARFTHGTLDWIRPFEDMTETHKNNLLD